MNSNEAILKANPDFYEKVNKYLINNHMNWNDIYMLDQNQMLICTQSQKMLGCPTCFQQQVYFNNGQPHINNVPAYRPNELDRYTIPDDIKANMWYCPVCRRLLDLIPIYNIPTQIKGE